MGDLKDRRLIYLKGVLFLVIVVICSVILFLHSPTWQTAVLLALLVWASARLYYFMFYVIEKYVDGEYKFSGIYSFLKYLLDN